MKKIYRFFLRIFPIVEVLALCGTTFSVSAQSGSSYRIWNWADLGYINTLIANERTGSGAPTERLNYYDKFILMQNLGIPGQPVTYGDGYHGGCSRTDTCPYIGDAHAERHLGCYGYQNYIYEAFYIAGSISTPSDMKVGGTDALPLATILSPNYAWDANGWKPIGSYLSPFILPFNSEFDGQHFEITGLWLNRPNRDNQGLFGYADTAVIRNLGVNIEGMGVCGKSYVGGLVGFINSSIIDSCYTTSNVTGSHYHVGGLAGLSRGGTITNSYTTGNVTGYMEVGGLAGSVEGIQGGNLAQANPVVENCYATGAVTTTGFNNYIYIGGLVGTLVDAIIKNSYATGAVTCTVPTDDGENVIGGLVGYAEHVEIRNSYATGIVTGLSVTGVPCRVGGLIGFLYDGTIVNCYASGDTVTGYQCVGGLVGYVTERLPYSSVSPIRPSYIDSCYAIGTLVRSGGDFVGGLVGYLRGDHTVVHTITNSYATANVTAVNEVGGLVGRPNGDVSIVRCYASGAVRGNNIVGGLVGVVFQNTLSECYATGNVNGSRFVGGLVGVAELEAPALNIMNCYATGIVTGDSILGGLVGSATGISNSVIVKNCFATGAVNGNGKNIGGLVGQANSTAIANCFALNPKITSTLTTPTIGRMVGFHNPTSVALNYNCALSCMLVNGDTIATTHVQAVQNGVHGLYITQPNALLESSYTTTPHLWNFTDVWTFDYAFGNSAKLWNVTLTTNLPILQAFRKATPVFANAVQPPKASCGEVYQIWNWADLGYLNTLIDNQRLYEAGQSYTGSKLSDYDKFALMQNIGIPGKQETYGDGMHGGISRMDTCPYIADLTHIERRFGYYGYQNYITAAAYLATPNATAIHPSNTLKVGGIGANQIACIAEAFKNDNTGWIPIGLSYGEYFSGLFNGQSFKISGLWTDRPSQDIQGLFGNVAYATIENVGVSILETKSVSGSYAIGGLAGFVGGDVSFSNCYTTGGAVEGDYYVGGLVGTLRHSTVTECYSENNVTGNVRVGGLAGESLNAPISNSYATGTVSGGWENAGGLVGQTNAAITNCYTTGEVTGYHNAGGLAGTVFGIAATLANCYATGKVTATNDYVGGLVGRAEPYASLNNCFALNPKISTSGTHIGRMTGFYDPTSVALIYNRALSCMLVNDDTIATTHPQAIQNGLHGLNITQPNALTETSYTSTPHLWNFTDVWTFDYAFGNPTKLWNVTPTTNLPILQAFRKATPVFANAVQPPKAECSKEETVYQIWNWADLGYINILIANEINNAAVPANRKAGYYDKFVLMQNLGIPDQPDTYGDGRHGGVSRMDTCPYIGDAVHPERQYGYYGYQNNITELGFYEWNIPQYHILLIGGTDSIPLDTIQPPNTYPWNYNYPWDQNGWKPIGADATYRFSGTFDGQGFEINGLWIYVYSNTRNYLGLFGYVEQGRIENIGVNTIVGNYYDSRTGIKFEQHDDIYTTVGILAGYVDSVSITNCHTTGYVSIRRVIGDGKNIGGLTGTVISADILNCYSTADVEGVTNMGGLIGYMYNGHVHNCYATGNVTLKKALNGSESAVGGLIGALKINEINHEITVTHCYATGNVRTIANTTGNLLFAIGGLLGEAVTSTNNLISVDGCYATGSVTVDVSTVLDEIAVGGFIGFAAGTYTNCYATSNVTLNVKRNNSVAKVGGFAGAMGSVLEGMLTTNGVIENCYATGKVVVNLNFGVTIANLATGGLVGGITGNNLASVSRSFAFNPEITATGSTTGRILGENLGSDNTLQYNQALKCMRVNGDTIATPHVQYGHNRLHGLNIIQPNALLQTTYTSMPYAWNFTSVWSLDYACYATVDTGAYPTNLPILRAFSNTIPLFAHALQPPNATCANCTFERLTLQNIEVCQGVAINLCFAIDASIGGFNVSGLPSGVAAIWNTAHTTLCISGAPSEVGTFVYTITPIGACAASTVSGTITVTPPIVPHGKIMITH